jgi:hypothetical protein
MVEYNINQRRNVIDAFSGNQSESNVNISAVMNIPLSDSNTDLTKKKAHLEKARKLAVEQAFQFVCGRGIIANIISGYINNNIDSILPFFPSLLAFAITHCGNADMVLLSTEPSSSQIPFDKKCSTSYFSNPNNALPLIFRHFMMKLLDVLVVYRPQR